MLFFTKTSFFKLLFIVFLVNYYRILLSADKLRLPIVSGKQLDSLLLLQITLSNFFLKILAFYFHLSFFFFLHLLTNLCIYLPYCISYS